MKIDLVFVNENTLEGDVSVISNIPNLKQATEIFNKLDATTKVEYAYLRKFSEWHYHIYKWLKRK